MMQLGDNRERGNGFLALRLDRALDLALRRKVAIRDWLTVVVLVSIVQALGNNSLETWAFATLLSLALLSVAIWALVVPRVSVPQALVMEACLNTSVVAIATFAVYASGGADSPYIFFFALPIVYNAAFLIGAAARVILIGLALLLAPLPIIYDTDAALAGDFVPTIVIAMFVCLATALLVTFKRVSAESAESNARSLSLVDQPSGAANRRALEQFAEELRRFGDSYALVLVRLVGVDAISNTQGHFAGDLVIRGVVDAMRESSLEVDQVGRISEDEFAVVLPRCELAEAERWRTRFRERLEILHAGLDHGARICVRAGCAHGADDVYSFAELLAQADVESVRLTQGDAEPGERIAPSERAVRLREQMEQALADRRSTTIASIDAPTEALISIPTALALGLAIAVTGGASSALFSLVILVAAYFATFGSRGEATVAVLTTLAAALAAAFAERPVSSVDQIRVLTILATVGVLADTMQRSSHSLVLAERRSAELSLLDPLTGLGNRHAFERDLAAMIPRQSGGASKKQQIEGDPAVIGVSLGEFESVRQLLDHMDAAFLIVELAEALRDCVGYDGEVYRLGQQEFMAIVRTHHEQHVDAVAARCFDQVRKLEFDHEEQLRGMTLDCRIGVSIWEQGMTAAHLAAAAIAKQSPRSSGSAAGQPSPLVGPYG